MSNDLTNRLMQELRRCLDDASDEHGAAQATGNKREMQYYKQRMGEIRKTLASCEYPEIK